MSLPVAFRPTAWLVVLLTLAMIAVTGGLIRWHLRVDQDRAAERSRLAAALEEYRARHGRYPASLAAAGVTPDPRIFPNSSYCAFDDGDWVELSVGLDYRWLGWTSWLYRGDRQTWTEHLDD